MTIRAHVVLKRKHLQTPVGFNRGVQCDKHAPHVRIQDPILVPVIHKFMFMRHRLDEPDDKMISSDPHSTQLKRTRDALTSIHNLDATHAARLSLPGVVIFIILYEFVSFI